MVVRLVAVNADDVHTADAEVSIAIVANAGNQIADVERRIRVIGRPQRVIRRRNARRLLVVNSDLEATAWSSRARTRHGRFPDREERA